MAGRLYLIDGVYVEGDEWRPSDATLMPDRTEDFDDAWRVAHRADGTHLPPVPQAWAAFAFAGGVYSRVMGSGITVARLATGHIRVTLDQPMRGAELWMAVVTPIGSEIAAAREVPGAKTASMAELKIETLLGSVQDAPIIVEAYGDLA